MDKTKIKKILVISLSNIGDIILTFPVVDILKKHFPQASLDCVIGPKGESLFSGNPQISRSHIFDKRQSWNKTWHWIRRLHQEHFDLIVDLRNTAIPFFLGARLRTPFFLKRSPKRHMLEQHLARLRTVVPFTHKAREKRAVFIPQETRDKMNDLLRSKMGTLRGFVVVSPGAADDAKRWNEAGFRCVCDRLAGDPSRKIVFVGDEHDKPVVRRIRESMKNPSADLSGQTTLVELAALFQMSDLAIVNDSAPLHLASYLDVPVVAIFGPTDPVRYGPWSQRSRTVSRKEECPACRAPQNRQEHTCMKNVTAQDVLKAVEEISAL